MTTASIQKEDKRLNNAVLELKLWNMRNDIVILGLRKMRRRKVKTFLKDDLKRPPEALA